MDIKHAWSKFRVLLIKSNSDSSDEKEMILKKLWIFSSKISRKNLVCFPFSWTNSQKIDWGAIVFVGAGKNPGRLPKASKFCS